MVKAEEYHSDSVELVIEQLSEISKKDPDRYQAIYIDLERAQIGDNLNDLDPAVKHLPHEVRAKVLLRLSGQPPEVKRVEPPAPKSIEEYN